MADQDRIKLIMDGDWDLDDLRSLTTSIRMGYSYFYWILQDPQTVDSAVKSGIARYFWSGNFVGDKFAQTLYDHIPEKQRLKLVSIQYASPGWIELAASLPIIWAFGHVAGIWVKTFDQAFALFRKVDKYFDERKLRRLNEKGSLKDINGAFVDEARDLCFEYGRHLGLKPPQIESVIDLTGNPIAALRLLVAISAEARKLHDLQKQGKIQLPQETTR